MMSKNEDGDVIITLVEGTEQSHKVNSDAWTASRGYYRVITHQQMFASDHPSMTEQRLVKPE